MLEPFKAVSPDLKAGFPPINTEVLPIAKGIGTLPDAGVLISPTTAAGRPPISTLGVPAPVIMPSEVMSVILAAPAILIY